MNSILNIQCLLELYPRSAINRVQVSISNKLVTNLPTIKTCRGKLTHRILLKQMIRLETNKSRSYIAMLKSKTNNMKLSYDHKLQMKTQ